MAISILPRHENLTAANYIIPNAILRVAGIASVLAGILMIGLILHPNGEEPTFGTDPFWVPAHGLVWSGLTLALVGWVGIYIIQAAEARNLGVVAFTITMLGTSLVSWIFSSDVTYVPAIAAEQPMLFQKIFSGAHVFLGVASVIIWVLGYSLFGFSIIRAKVFPHWSGVLLVGGSLFIPIAYFLHLPVKVVAIGAILIGISQIWLGLSLLRALPART
jgi:hypothetical protein